MPSVHVQDNLLKHKEIHVNPTLWIDKIYYLERNPYWNSSYDFLPTPKKYALIIEEFLSEIEQQKEQVRSSEEEARKAKEIQLIHEYVNDVIRKAIMNMNLDSEAEEKNKKSEVVSDWTKWKNISLDFTEKLVKECLDFGLLITPALTE